jgi:ABC-type bacteriocin/lantibiotic exporters, contain an N-terminal double-glycine peptidase domain
MSKMINPIIRIAEDEILQSTKPTIQPLQVYRWLFHFVIPYKRVWVLFLLSSFFLSAVELSVPEFIEWFTNYIAPERDFTALGIMLGSIGMLFAVAIFVMGRKNSYQKILQEKPSMDILEDQFEHLRKLGFSYYEQHPTGETLSMFQGGIGRLIQCLSPVGEVL